MSRTAPDYQLALVDLPGFQRPMDALTERMQKTVDASFDDVDAVLLVVDARAHIGAGDRFVARRVFGLEKPVVIALNKVDRLKPAHIASQMKTAAALGDFHALHPVSAKTKDGVGELRSDLVFLLPEGPAYFPDEQTTDLTLEERIAEVIREKALHLTREEVPHALIVEVEEIEERRLRAVIYVETESQKGILVGKKGAMVREIGTRARPEVEALVGRSRLPRAPGQGAAEVAPRPADARAPRPLTEPPPSTAVAARRTTLGAWPRHPHSSVASSSRPARGFRAIGSVDAVALEERAATLAKRSIKRESKVQALELAVRMMDLTTLEGQDTPGKVAALCSKAMRPDPVDLSVPPVAAVCIYPSLVGVAKERLAGSGVKVASVATAFPSGQSPTEIKVAETRAVVEFGADEVDMVIDRGAFLSGRYAKVFDEIVRVKEACGDAHLKVILETGELGTYDNVRRASLIAIAAGADFIKTSTGKVSPAATLPVTLCMMEVVRDVYAETGHIVGIKPAGGIRASKQAIQYLVTLYETLGPQWMTPDLFRFGASSLLNDVLMQLRKEKTGRYQSGDYFTID